MKLLIIIILTLSLPGCDGQKRYDQQIDPQPKFYGSASYDVQKGHAKQGEHLFQIVENGKIGFIDSGGIVAIEPIFLVAGEFSEGLANARVNGTYGYINEIGKFIIQPQFDYATPFNEGLAIVYKGGQPFFINTNGQKAFECNFSAVGQFQNGRAIVKTSSNKFGIINKQGKLFIDTAYSRISTFIGGLAVVQGEHHHPYTDREKGIKKKYEVGVIDTLGNFVIPYGKFEEIGDFEDGYFKAEIPAEPWDTIGGYTAKTAIIDRRGKIIISKDHKNHCYINGNLHCGLAKMYLYRYWIPEDKGVISTSEKSYQGYMNLKGDIFINDTTYESVEDFSDNRAFVEDNDWHYSIINRQGKVIAKNSFNRILGSGFQNGVAFVAVDSKWGLIDTNANFIIKPQFSGIDDAGMIDDYFFFFEETAHEKSGYDKLTGIAKKDGSILLKPIMQEFDRGGFINGLLKCVVNGRLTYINQAGNIIWQESEIKSKQFSNLNIDFMNRGYFYAYSLPDKKEHSGGWAESENIPQKVSRSSNFQTNTLSILVNTNAREAFSNAYSGYPVYVVNNTKGKINFNAQDSRLYMKVQALNSKGEWKDIEYLPGSWCGNSYHTLTLQPKYFWTFITPHYEGDFKTKLRIELKYIDPADKTENEWDKKEVTVYSNEYDGSINPGQFWRKEDYYPNGIMNPYND